MLNLIQFFVYMIGKSLVGGTGDENYRLIAYDWYDQQDSVINLLLHETILVTGEGITGIGGGSDPYPYGNSFDESVTGTCRYGSSVAEDGDEPILPDDTAPAWRRGE